MLLTDQGVARRLTSALPTGDLTARFRPFQRSEEEVSLPSTLYVPQEPDHDSNEVGVP